MARERVDALLQTVSVRADLKDSRLTPRELSGLGTTWPGFLGLSLFYGKRHPMMDELFHELVHSPMAWSGPEGMPGGVEHRIAFPLIRLLHLRMILEAPELAAALSHPEDALVPEVLLWILSRDAVSYWPELRVHEGAERRWRARWVESSAEAISVLLLDDAVGLDFSTLTRIEELPEETPDFQAMTVRGEPVVFESKGSADWATHLAQRRKALRQLRKSGPRRRVRTSEARGRSFGCALFTAQEGDERSSLVHVADPDFGFPELFGDGWERHSRTRHYAAVAEAGLMHGLADRLLEGKHGFDGQVETYTLGDLEAGGTRYRGTTLDVEFFSRLMRSRASDYRSVRIFVGMDEPVYGSLVNGVLPQDGDVDPAQSGVPPVGLVPGRKGEPPRGVYSRLSDGAFLAVELE